ncbi:hypothetical protein WJX77_007077 [Trebouxia sp. C0004]
MLDEQLITRALFGGAIKMSLPQRFVDVSDYRPVPDHQEVWTDATLDQSVILEIVEHQPVPDQDCCKLYFNDVAEHNQAATCQIQSIRCPTTEEIPEVAGEALKAVVTGLQSVAKGRQEAHTANDVQIQLAVFRYPDRGSDILVTMNTPVFINEASAAAQHTGAGHKTAHRSAPELFASMLKTFHIFDYTLFG